MSIFRSKADALIAEIVSVPEEKSIFDFEEDLSVGKFRGIMYEETDPVKKIRRFIFKTRPIYLTGEEAKAEVEKIAKKQRTFSAELTPKS